MECSVAPDMPARIDSRKAGRIGTFRAICEFLGCMGDRSCISTAARMKDEAAWPRRGNLRDSAGCLAIGR